MHYVHVSLSQNVNTQRCEFGGAKVYLDISAIIRYFTPTSSKNMGEKLQMYFCFVLLAVNHVSLFKLLRIVTLAQR